MVLHFFSSLSAEIFGMYYISILMFSENSIQHWLAGMHFNPEQFLSKSPDLSV